jgi:hypothetical protein
MRRLLTTIIASAVLAAPLLTSGAASAEATVGIKPGQLARGADVAVPHLEGTTIVDGTTRIKVKSPRVILYGKWNNGYIAATGDSGFGDVRLVKVARSGTIKVLREFIDPFNTVLDAAAGQVAYSYGDAISRPTLAVTDLRTKDEIATHPFASLPTLLDFDEGLIVTSFASFHVRTLTWDTVSDDVVEVNQKQANYASSALDLVGFFSRDPFDGGCQVLARLSDPTKRLWTSCDERIEEVAPDGRRMATVALLSDGAGPADVGLRTSKGKLLTHYTINGRFTELSFESPQALLLDSFGRVQHAVVRCVVTACERASDLEPTPPLRPLGSP